MGIWDAIKSVANMVTGGGANLTLTVGPRATDGSFPVKVKAVIADADLKVERVYLKIEGMETIKYKANAQPVAQASAQAAQGSAQPAPTAVSRGSEDEKTDINHTYSEEKDLAPGGTFTAKKEYEWEGKFSVPADAQPTYEGKKAKHEWRVYAGLAVTGTDPSSNWSTFVVR